METLSHDVDPVSESVEKKRIIDQNGRTSRQVGTPASQKYRGAVDHIIVVIPAHNEQRRLAKAVSSALVSAAAVGDRVATSIVVVADACSDRTAALAKQQLSGLAGFVMQTTYANVGRARGAGTAAALVRNQTSLQRTWIASTDADTVMPRAWLLNHLEAAESGLDAVAGTVELLEDQDVDERLQRRFDAYYEVDESGTHRHVHAANLGVRAVAYQSVGGWAPLATGEDHDLWDRLSKQDWRIGSSAEMHVWTSARRQARAPSGFAADMVLLDASPEAA